MRVGIDVTPLLGNRTGIGNVVAGWFDELRKHEEVELVPFTVSGRDRSGAGVGAVALPLPASFAHRLWHTLDRPRADRPLGNPDLVHGTNYLVPPARAPRLVTVYDLSFVHDPIAAGPSVREFDRYVGRLVERGVIVHTTSHFVAREIEERYGAAAQVVLPGLELLADEAQTRDVDRLDAEPPTIVAVGTATRRKRFPLLIEAFEAVLRDVPDAQLVIAGGEADDSEQIVRAVEGLPEAVARRVELIGRVDDVARLYRRATVVAHPSSYEGFGLPVLEAMAHGIPVVAAAGGAVPEVAGGAARLVPVDDRDMLAAALVEVLGDPDQRSSLARAGLERVRQFSWASSGEQLVGLYRSVVG